MTFLGTAFVLSVFVPGIALAQEFAPHDSQIVAYRTEQFSSAPASVRPPLQEEASAPRIRRGTHGTIRGVSASTSACESKDVGALAFCLPEGWVAGERAPRTTLGNDGINDVIGYFVDADGVDQGSIIAVRNTQEQSGLRSAYSRKISRSMRDIPGYRKIGIIPVSVAGYEVPLHVFEGEVQGIKNRYYHLAFVQKRLGYGVLATVPAATAVDGHADMLRSLKSVSVKDERR